MSIRELSLRELRALAQQRLGNRAAELKTRQELVDALEAGERKRAPRTMVPLAAPLPAPAPAPTPVPEPVKELPPEPVIWTGAAPLPQITPRPLLDEFPPPAAGEGARAAAPQASEPGASEPITPRPPPPERSRAAAAPQPEPAASGPAAPRPPPPEFARSPFPPPGLAPPGAAPPTPPDVPITQYFFLPPGVPRVPLTYGDDRLLTFVRDPRTLYAAWDFSAGQLEQGPARALVVSESGATVQSFALAGPAGGQFIEALPAGGKVKVEVRGEAGLLAQSGWVQLPPPVDRVEPLNAPSSVV